MEWAFDTLKEHAGSLRQLSMWSTGLTIAVFGWICRAGGEPTIMTWLHKIQSRRRKDAKDKIRTGAKAVQAKDKEIDEVKLDGLCVGLDTWNRLSSQLRGWTRGVTVCKWGTLGIAVATAAIQVTSRVTKVYGVTEAFFSVLWITAAFLYLLYFAPFVLLNPGGVGKDESAESS
jgi:hypothetical protein